MEATRVSGCESSGKHGRTTEMDGGVDEGAAEAVAVLRVVARDWVHDVRVVEEVAPLVAAVSACQAVRRE